MTPKDYERAVVERFRIAWPAPAFEVRHDVKLPGRKTQRARQIDIAIYESGQPVPVMLVEVKRHRRAINANVAGSTIALYQDVGHCPTVMVSTSGFSLAAKNHLASERISHLTITLAEARGLRWIPEVERRFAVAAAFKIVAGDLTEALRSNNAVPFLDDGVPFEEWLAIFATGLSKFPGPTVAVLKQIATSHFDDAHRFNAVQLLLEEGALDHRTLTTMLASEQDADTRNLLRDALSDAP